MTCNEKEVDQYRQLVDAVARAYEEHVVFANRKQQYHKRDVMMKTLAKLQDEIRRKMEDFHDLAKEIGSAEHAGDAAVMQQLAMRRLARIEDELMRLENEMIQLEVELELRGKGPDKDLRLRRDALSKRLAQLTERREQLTDDLTTRGETSVDLTVRRQELDQLSAVASDMARRIEALDIDMDAPQRITKIQPATASQIGK